MSPSTRTLSAMWCFALALPAVFVAIAVACSDSKPKATVQASLKEFSVTPSLSEVEHGRVHFVAKNEGTMTHELAVVSIDEKGNKHEVAEAEDIAPGRTKSSTPSSSLANMSLPCGPGRGGFNG